MSNFNIVENTRKTFSGNDFLIAGSIVGSFLFLAIKSHKDKITVLRPKNAKDGLKKMIESEIELTNKSNVSQFSRKLATNTIVINPLSFAAEKSSETSNTNQAAFHSNIQKEDDFLKFLPKIKQLRIEAPLFSEEELLELKGLADFYKKKKEQQQKVLENENKANYETSDGGCGASFNEEWSVVDYSIPDFNFERVYEDFIQSQYKKKQHSEMKKLGEQEEIQSKIEKNHEEEKEEEEEKRAWIPTEVSRKSSNSLLHKKKPIDTRGLLKKFESRIATCNPFSPFKRLQISKEFAQKRETLIDSISSNILLSLTENGDFKGSAKIHLKVNSQFNQNIESNFFIDFSGNSLIQVKLNEEELPIKEIWQENRIYLKNLKTGINNLTIFFENEGLRWLSSFQEDGNSLVFSTNKNNSISNVIPCIDQPGFYTNFTLGLLLPIEFYAISNCSELVNQEINNTFQSKLLQSHRFILNEEDLTDRRLFIFRFASDALSFGLSFGNLICHFQNQLEEDSSINFRIFSNIYNQKRDEEENFIDTLEIERLIQKALKFFSQSIGHRRSPAQLQIKLDIIFLSDLNVQSFSKRGIIFLNKSLAFKKTQNQPKWKNSKLYWHLLSEVAKQFIIFEGFKWYDSLHFANGLANFFAFSFLRQQFEEDNPLIFQEIQLYLINIKNEQILCEISQPIAIAKEIEDSSESLNKSVWKTFYFLRQLALIINEEALIELLKQKLSFPFTILDFTNIFSNEQDNEHKFIENWLKTVGVSIVEPVCQSTQKEDIELQQKPAIGGPFQIISNFLVLDSNCNVILNQKFSFFQKNIKNDPNIITFELQNLEKNCFLKGNKIKAIILDSTNSSYFRFQIDAKSLLFLANNVSGIKRQNVRLQVYYSLYFEVLYGILTPIKFLNSVLKNIESEKSEFILKIVLNISHKLLRSGFIDLKQEENYSEKFVNMLMRKMDAGGFQRYSLFIRLLANFSFLPKHLALLVQIYESSILENNDKKSLLPLFIRICSSKDLDCNKRKTYIEEFLANFNPVFQKKLKLTLGASSSQEKKKIKTWNKLVNNHWNIELPVMKGAMKHFWQQGKINDY